MKVSKVRFYNLTIEGSDAEKFLDALEYYKKHDPEVITPAHYEYPPSIVAEVLIRANKRKIDFVYGKTTGTFEFVKFTDEQGNVEKIWFENLKGVGSESGNFLDWEFYIEYIDEGGNKKVAPLDVGV